MPRGRKSAASTEVTPMMPGAGRPPPPAVLDPVEARAWRDVIDSLPGHWVDTAGQLVLRRLCTQIAFVERLEQQIRDAMSAEAIDDERLTAMASIHAATSKSVAFLLGTLRATPKTRMVPRDARVEPSHREPALRPWEIRADVDLIQ